MSKLKRNLDLIWSEATGQASRSRRYRAKSLDGGTGWGVWDERERRFLKDREVAAKTAEQLREPWTN